MNEEENNEETFSPFSKILIGSVSGLFGLMMISIAPPTDKAIFFYMFGGFCLIISLTCIFKGRLRQFFGSVIGACIFVLSILYLVNQIFEGQVDSGSRSEPSIINAVMFLIVFGLPGLGYCISSKFGFVRKSP